MLKAHFERDSYQADSYAIAASPLQLMIYIYICILVICADDSVVSAVTL